jgi:hypothetical protein
MMAVTPNLQIHPENYAAATSAAAVLARGRASGGQIDEFRPLTSTLGGGRGMGCRDK